MKFNRKLVSSVLVMSMFAQAALAVPANVVGNAAPSVTYKELIGTSKKAGNADVIKKELHDFKVRIDSGSMSQKDSIDVLTKSLVDNGVSIADIDTYVQNSATPKQYKEFKASLTSALKGVNPETMTSKDMSGVLATAITNSNAEGLAWSGCAGLAIGVILVISAVVVGIVALTKTRGEMRIRSIYQEKRSTRTTQYSRDTYLINTHIQTDQQEIATLQGKITANNNRISFLNGEISGAIASNPHCSSDPTCSQNVMNWTTEIQAKQQQNTDYNSQIAQINLDIAQWNSPGYVDLQLAQCKQTYQQDMTEIDIEERQEIDLIPANKALAVKLGIGAGIGAAVGIYLIIDGAHDGGC